MLKKKPSIGHYSSSKIVILAYFKPREGIHGLVSKLSFATWEIRFEVLISSYATAMQLSIPLKCNITMKYLSITSI
jgi:hypothetical protein